MVHKGVKMELITLLLEDMQILKKAPLKVSEIISFV